MTKGLSVKRKSGADVAGSLAHKAARVKATSDRHQKLRLSETVSIGGVRISQISLPFLVADLLGA